MLCHTAIRLIAQKVTMRAANTINFEPLQLLLPKQRYMCGSLCLVGIFCMFCFSAASLLLLCCFSAASLLLLWQVTTCVTAKFENLRQLLINSRKFVPAKLTSYMIGQKHRAGHFGDFGIA